MLKIYHSMNLPLKTIKDSTRRFPIPPLTIYVMSDKSDYYHNAHKEIFDSCVNNPPFSLLPVEYIFIPRRQKPANREEGATKIDIFDEFADYNVITRDADEVVCDDFESIFSEPNYAAGYLCGKLRDGWKLWLNSSLSSFIGISLLKIKENALKLIFMAHSLEVKDDPRIDAAKKIAEICDKSMDILAGKSDENIRPRIEEMRQWLHTTAIMRKIPDNVSEDSITESFKSGEFRKDYYGIVIKKIGASNVYRVHLRVGDRLYLINSKEQAIHLYLFAIAFASKGQKFNKAILLRDTFTGSAIRKGIATIYNCYCALEGIDIGSLKEALVRPFGFKGARLSSGFERFYHQLCITEGEYNNDKLIKIISRLNNTYIKKTLGDQPKEIQELFKLKFNKPPRGFGYYYIDIPPENIVIE